MNKKNIFILVSLVSFLFSCTSDRDIPGKKQITPKLDHSLVHYWDFNNNNALLVPTLTIGDANITYKGDKYDVYEEGSDLNLRENKEAGSALRLRTPGGDLILDVPTTEHKDILFSYAVQRSKKGPETQKISYSINGNDFIDTNLQNPEISVGTNYSLQQFDFSSIPEVNNNKNFKIKISFTGDSGNFRFDNITIDGVKTGNNTNLIEPENTDTPTEPGNTDTPEQPGNTDTPTEPENTDSNKTVFHYWNFNNYNPENIAALIVPTKGNGNLSYEGEYDKYDDGTALNAQNDDEAGAGLRLKTPSEDLIISIPTVNHKNIIVRYATHRSNKGPAKQYIYYTIDGVNYIQDGLKTTEYTINAETYEIIEIDLSNIVEVNNNANFKLKIVFENTKKGNSRFDNITVEGNTL